MSSSNLPDGRLDLDRDLPVTGEDVGALRRAAREVPSWLTLDGDELEALLPPDALARRPTAQDTWEPFSLE